MNGLAQYQIRFVRVVMDGKAQEVNRKEVITNMSWAAPPMS